MQTVLKSYQERAARRVHKHVFQLQRNGLGEKQSRVLVKGDCGTGKTLIIGRSIELLAGAKHLSRCSDRGKNGTVFLFLTPGSGNLEEQSRNRLKHELSGSGISVRSIKEHGVLKSAPHNGLVITSNYECLVSKGDDNKHINLLTREGEDSNLYNFIKAVNRRNFELVVILDEAHHGNHGHSGRISELINSVTDAMGNQLVVRIEATATSKNDPERTVTVPREKAIKDGIIRPRQYVNFSRKGGSARKALRTKLRRMAVEFDNANGELAYLMYEQYKEVHAETIGGELSYVPLMVISVNNGEEGKFEIELFKRFFSEATDEKITQENGKLKVILSEEKLSYADQVALSKVDSPVKVVIIKKAVATGWDCPRAQFLLITRRIGKDGREVFLGQLTGRTGRNVHGQPRPEGQEASRYGYIYTDANEQMVLDKVGAEVVYAKAVEANPKHLELWNKSGLVRSVNSRTNRGGKDASGSDITRPFYVNLFSKGDVSQERLSLTPNRRLALNITGHQILVSGERLKSNLAVDDAYGEQLESAVLELLKGHMRDKGVKVVRKNAEVALGPFKDFLKEKRQGASDAYIWGIILQDHEVDPVNGGAAKMMSQIADAARERERATHRNDFVRTYYDDYTVPEVRHYTEDVRERVLPDIVGAYHLFGPVVHHSTDSSIEIAFEETVVKWFAESGLLISWFRIGKIDSYGKAFSMGFPNDDTMELEHNTHTNPDYGLLVHGKYGNPLPFIVETKGYCPVTKSATDRGADAKVRDIVRIMEQQTDNTGRYGRRGHGEEKGTHIAAVLYQRPSGTWMVQLDGKSVPLRTWVKPFVSFPA